MAKDPAFLFYASDFITGVQDLTMEERGQYITLLCIEHQKGRLSKKIIDLSVGNATADVMLKFKIDESGLYYNERLEAEIEKRKQYSDKQRVRAIDGWKKRKDAHSHGNATAMPIINENIIINENTNKDNIPSVEEFLNHALSKEPLVNISSVKLKYDAWKEAGWKNGNGKKITNWKSNLNNTLPYLPKEKSKTKKEEGNEW